MFINCSILHSFLDFFVWEFVFRLSETECVKKNTLFMHAFLASCVLYQKNTSENHPSKLMRLFGRIAKYFVFQSHPEIVVTEYINPAMP